MHRLVATLSQSAGPICTALSRINSRRSLPGIDRAHGESRDSHGIRPSARRQNHDVTCVFDARRCGRVRTVLNRRACHLMGRPLFLSRDGIVGGNHNQSIRGPLESCQPRIWQDLGRHKDFRGLFEGTEHYALGTGSGVPGMVDADAVSSVAVSRSRN